MIYLLILSFFIVYLLIRNLFYKNIKDYSSKIWVRIEVFWLLISFLAVLIGFNEIGKLDQQNKYLTAQKNAKAQYKKARLSILAHSAFLVNYDKRSSLARENANWFSQMLQFLEAGNEDRWQKFLYFTKGYVLDCRGCVVTLDQSAQNYGWPQDKTIDPTQLQSIEEIKIVVKELDKLQSCLYKVEKFENLRENKTFYKFILPFIFIIGLSFKLLRLESDYYRNKTLHQIDPMISLYNQDTRY